MCSKTKKVLALCSTHGSLKKMSDRLDILRVKCEREISETEEKLRVLKAKLASLIALAQESEKLANPQSEPDRYNETGLTEAVFDAINVFASTGKGGASATEIKNYLLAHGFRPSENFDTAIYTVLTRLREGGKIRLREIKNAGVPVFGGGILRIPSRKIYTPVAKISGTGAGLHPGSRRTFNRP
jgi:hypothetical protein